MQLDTKERLLELLTAADLCVAICYEESTDAEEVADNAAELILLLSAMRAEINSLESIEATKGEEK